MKSLHLTLALALTLSAAASAAPAWQSLPRYGGPATALAASSGVVYTGTETGGVFRSTAGGAVWRPSEEGLQSLRILQVAAQPSRPSVVFATAQTVSEQSVGALRSTDGGLSWTRVNHGLGDNQPLEVSALVFNPFDAGTLYAATSDGLFRTRNQGQSWQQVGLDGSLMLALAADPFHPGSLLASAFQGGFVLLGSTDGGATWTPRNQGIPSNTAFSVLFFDPRAPDKVLAAGNGWPTYVSRDAGATWTNAGHPLSSLATGPGGTLLGARYAADGVLRSTDGGFTWSPAGALADTINQLLFAGGRHYAAGILGIWVSADGGTTWRPSSQGLSARTYKDLTAVGGALYVDAMEGLLASTDGGLSWRRVRNAARPEPPLGRILATVPGAIYAATDPEVSFEYIARSTDGGATWTPIDPGLGGDRFVLAVDPRHPNVLYAGSNMLNGPDQILCHLAKSVDTGRTWTCLFSEASVGRMIVEPTTSILYLPTGSDVAALVGSRFERRDAGLPFHQTEAIAFDPKKAGTINSATSNGVFKTTDGGLLWKRSGQGIAAGTRMHSVAVDPRRTATVYAGSNGRVYRSRNSGATWELLGAGLPARVPVTELTPDGTDANNPLRLYAVVEGRGLYAVDLEP
jgi:photosystem II stability/assembly factor-like uncharacterized protein